MPFYLKDRDFLSETAGVRSALIVPCRFCPAASLAVRDQKPYIELFRSFLTTRSYAQYIQALQSRLASQGITAQVYDLKLPYDFVVCMWSQGRRQDLERQAAKYDAVIVLACDAAVETARLAVGSTGCRVIPGMQVEGIMNVIPSLHFPFNIHLQVSKLIRVLLQDGSAGRGPELKA